MKKIIKELIISILINAILLYVASEYLPELGFGLVSSQYPAIITFGILWSIFWFLNNIIKTILKTVTLPLKILTLGLSSLIINIGIFYLFKYVLDSSTLWIAIQLGNILQVFILSIIITWIYFLIKKFV